MKKKEFRTIRRSLGTSRATLNIPISESQRCQKKKEGDQEIENLFEKQ